MLQRKKVFHYVSVLKHDKFGLIPKHPEADCQKALLLPDEEGPALLGKTIFVGAECNKLLSVTSSATQQRLSPVVNLFFSVLQRK